MAEAEDVLQDLARHATVFAQDLWARHGRKAAPDASILALGDVATRLDLLLTAVFGRCFPIRVAESPAPPTFLGAVFRHREGPHVADAIAATDDTSIWLPARMQDHPGLDALALYRTVALRQAARAVRGSAAAWLSLEGGVAQALFTMYEAQAADMQLLQMLPGMLPALQALRYVALQARPAVQDFPSQRQPVERLLQSLLQAELIAVEPLSVEAVIRQAEEDAAKLAPMHARRTLFRDIWTGEFRRPSPTVAPQACRDDASQPDAIAPSARMVRRPRIRQAQDGEDDREPGAWMVQTAQPHEQAEDPMGMQRPTDRQASTAADELADSLSELPEARLVVAPGRPKEILLSDDMIETHAARSAVPNVRQGTVLRYPEWDWRMQCYQADAVSVHIRPPVDGSQAWVDVTLKAHHAMLGTVRRHFEMLKPQRLRVSKQLEGDELDLNAYTDGLADFRAGLPLPQALYQSHRRARRDMAVLILIDVSGSTDAWVSAGRRVIDVEKEALLLVATALDGMLAPTALQAFSGEGPHGVVVRPIQDFAERLTPAVALRIASLEPEHYTRAGAAIRHATASLMQEPASHRLLLLLSDGKPNDVDHYEGRHGIEDMRQAVMEARLQGVQPFCLTVDRQGAAYLPRVFGHSQYGILPNPERLPGVLLEWMRRLVRA